MRPIYKALIGSLAVYLVPLAGPHALFFLGGWLASAPRRLEGQPQWTTLEIAAALGLQALAFGILYWHFRWRSIFTWMILLLSVPALVMTVNFTFFIALPAYFLIDKDTRPELTGWRQVCTAPGWWLEPVRSSPFSPVLLLSNEREYAWLSMPGCGSRSLMPRNRRQTVESISPAGAMVLRENKQRWLVRPGKERLALAAADDSSVAVSDDGGVAGVLQRRTLYLTGKTQPVMLGLPELGSNVLAALDTQRERVTVIRNSAEIWTLGTDGQPRGTPLVAGEGGLTQNLQLGKWGWLTWDLYRDRGRYRVVWSIDGKVRKHEALNGRSINHAARNPAGNLIAISASSALNIGSFPDMVYVLRASDSLEVYRRHLPRYTRTQVHFVDDTRLAYTVINNAVPEVIVVQAPSP